MTQRQEIIKMLRDGRSISSIYLEISLKNNMDSVMEKREKCQVTLVEMLIKEFLSQFKIEGGASSPIENIHYQRFEQIRKGEMDARLGYNKDNTNGYNSDNLRNGGFSKKIHSNMVRILSKYSLTVMVILILCRTQT